MNTIMYTIMNLTNRLLKIKKNTKDVHMHTIIKNFINSNEGLTSILEKDCNKSQFLELTFLKMIKKFNQQIIEPSLYAEIDDAAIKGHPDPRIHFLFISSAISFTSIRKDIARSNALVSIAESIEYKDFEKILVSYFIIAKATLNFMARKSEEGGILTKKALELIDRKHPRYQTILINAANNISTEGQLKELNSEDILILEKNLKGLHESTSKQALLKNAIYTCQLEEGKIYYDKFSKAFSGDARFLLIGFNQLLNVIAGEFDENKYSSKAFKIYVNILKKLIEGNIHEAKNIYQNLKVEDLRDTIQIVFLRYLELHFELGLKNLGKAKLLFHELINENGHQYMDDFFLARIQLLEKDKYGAIDTFNRLINNVNRYSAYDRLSFELQFAKDIKNTDILFLMHSTQQKIVANEKFKKPINLNSKTKSIELMIGNCASIMEIKKLIKKYAIINEPILISGETGTGKELIARAIHDEGAHSKEPFLGINCGSLTDSLLQSELFGYETGAFTGAQKERKGIFETAGKGTVFLDEFGDISPKLQASLLRVLESNEIRTVGGTTIRKIECKIVVAVNNELKTAVEEKKFREDLYFRLARFDIKIPPLRERIEDIPILIDYFLNKNRDKGEKSISISKELLDTLIKYRWPGNIRELKNEVERLKILHADKEILGLEEFDFEHLWGVRKKPINIETISNENKTEKSTSNIPNTNDIHIEKILEKGNKVNQRHQTIIELFQKYKKLTRSQIVQIIPISAGTATSDLKILCKKKVISRISPSKSKKSDYFIWNEKN